jgi:hypothetical protein
VKETEVAALAETVGLPLPPERHGAVADLLQSMTRDGGGAVPDELEGVEPATVFEPGWPS